MYVQFCFIVVLIFLSGNKAKYDSVLQAFFSGEFEYAIEHPQVMKILSCSADEAKEYVKAHCPNPSGM